MNCQLNFVGARVFLFVTRLADRARKFQQYVSFMYLFLLA